MTQPQETKTLSSQLNEVANIQPPAATPPPAPPAPPAPLTARATVDPTALAAAAGAAGPASSPPPEGAGGTGNDFQDALDAFDKQYSNQKAQSLDIVEAGSYQMVIVELSLQTRKSKGSLVPIIDCTVCILVPPYEGKTIRFAQWLNNDVGIAIWKEWLVRLGKDPSTPLKQLEPVLLECRGVKIIGDVRNRSGSGDRIFTNVYIKEVIGKDDSYQHPLG